MILSSRYALSAAMLAVLVSGKPLRAEITGTSFVANLPGSGTTPVYATHAPGRPDELFVVDQRGLIQILDLGTGNFNSSPFLDIQSLVVSGGEQGLLGLAFDPDYENNGFFYVNYTRDPVPGPGGLRTRVDRFQATNPASIGVVSVGTRQSILEFGQDFNNHNGGWIDFSPNDGYLYISTGDGGSGNDPNNRSQRLNTRLGKMLRIDVGGDDFPSDTVENYAVPSDNPFVERSDALDEIWAYGLRNPWRASFDRETGDLWIGDVGQGAREEINFQSGDSEGGENYGWRLREGDIQTPGSVGGPAPIDHAPPIYDYLSDGEGLFGGNSVVGGYVYRGPDPEVQGRYFFADSFPTQLWSFDPADASGTVSNVESVLNPSGSINTPVAFSEDAVGNLYILTRGGDIFRIDTDSLLDGDFNADGIVNENDLVAWRDTYGSREALAADGNGDGVIDAADYTIWRDALGGQPASSSGVPEPSAWLISLSAWAIASSMRRPPVNE